MPLDTIPTVTQSVLDAIQKIPSNRHVTVLERADFSSDRALAECVDRVLQSHAVPVQERVRAEIFGLGPLESLMLDNEVTEILILGHRAIWLEKNGRLEPSNDRFHDELTYRNAVSRLAKEARTAVDHASPFADGRWRGFRVHVVGEPIVQSGPHVTLRRIRATPWSLSDLEQRDWAPQEGMAQLQKLIDDQCNLLIVGGTGSGKTSVLGACLGRVAATERCLLLEDTDELPLPNGVSAKLLTKRARIAGDTAYDLDSLLKQALRMRPDRLVLGEVRGAEAKDLLMAFATGHRGCMGTLHANSPREAMLRLEMLVQMGAPQWNEKTVKQLIHSAIDAIVCVSRTESGERRLESISRVASLEEIGFCFTPLYARRLMKLPFG